MKYKVFIFEYSSEEEYSSLEEAMQNFEHHVNYGQQYEERLFIQLVEKVEGRDYEFEVVNEAYT